MAQRQLVIGFRSTALHEHVTFHTLDGWDGKEHAKLVEVYRKHPAVRTAFEDAVHQSRIWDVMYQLKNAFPGITIVWDPGP